MKARYLSLTEARRGEKRERIAPSPLAASSLNGPLEVTVRSLVDFSRFSDVLFFKLLRIDDGGRVVGDWRDSFRRGVGCRGRRRWRSIVDDIR